MCIAYKCIKNSKLRNYTQKKNESFRGTWLVEVVLARLAFREFEGGVPNDDDDDDDES